MPLPNVIAGILIGVSNSTLIALLIANVVWSIAFFVYGLIFERVRIEQQLFHLTQNPGGKRLFGSPLLTLFAIEFTTALMTAGSVSLITKFIIGL
jgi:hypothetical protein